MASPYKGTNMALKDIINGLFRRNQPAVMDTSVAEIPQEQGIYNLLAQKFQAETNRMRIVKVCREMYRVDARIEKSLRTLARDTLGSGFMVKVTEGTPSAQEEADKLQVRLGLNQKLEKYVRLSGRDGDSMLEIGVNEGMDISSLTRKPTLQIYRNTDITDRFIDPEKAFWMSNEIWAGTMGQEPPKDALWFAEWQIIHARWQHDEESRYGTPAFASSISAFKRVSEGETDVAIRRKVRAGMVMHHVVEGSASDIEKYKETNRAALEAPFAAMRDMFTNKTGSITAIQGDAHLNEIEDIKHHIATMFTGGEVPMELIAYGGDLNRDVLGEKKAEYAEILRQIREWVTEEMIKPLLERQWLLKGILPEGLKYTIEWRRASSLTAQDVQAITNAAVQMRLLGVPEQAIQAVLANYLPGVDAAMLLPTGSQSDTQKFADILKGISV
jgi:hypothetical protein